MQLNFEPNYARKLVGLRNRKRPKLLEQIKRQWQLTNADLILLISLAASLVYAAWVEPFLTCLVLLAGSFFYSVNKLFQLIPGLEKWVGIKVRLWHLGVGLVATIALLSTCAGPAQALFLSGLEEYVTGIAEVNGDIDPEAISLVFQAIRAIFLILVAVAALYAYNMAQQGNDWRPIAGQVAMAFGMIATIDVITFLFIGGAS